MENKSKKNILNNSVVRMIGALTIVGIISGAILVFVYKYATPRIENNIKAATNRAIENIFPDAQNVQKEKDIYKVTGKDGNLMGYAFTAEGNGYQGTIKLLVGIDPEISAIQGIEILESQETPGLGAEISGNKFKKQFKNLSVSEVITYVKNKKPEKPGEIEAIAGATISSRAVVSIINKKMEEIKRQRL